MSRSTPLVLILCTFLILPWICQVVKAETTPAATAEERVSWSAKSTNSLYEIRIAPRDGRVLIGQFQAWDLRLTTPTGEPIFPARFAIGGGMLGHGHGLPTQPKVTGIVKEGSYIIEGLKFNMAGAWTLYFTIEIPADNPAGTATDQARIDIQVDY